MFSYNLKGFFPTWRENDPIFFPIELVGMSTIPKKEKKITVSYMHNATCIMQEVLQCTANGTCTRLHILNRCLCSKSYVLCLIF